MKYLLILLLCLFQHPLLLSAGSGEPAGPSPTSQLYRFYLAFESDGVLPDFDLFQLAVTGHLNLKENNKLGDKELLTIVDFRKPSTQKRLWVMDLKTKKVLFHTLVAHGRNTGELYAEKFSNTPNSNSSSIGFYVTSETYTGKHGLSLRLDGQETGFNEKARNRAIVMHGADYVSGDFVKKHGRLGRSFGCPSVPMEVHEAMINTIKDGSSLLIFYPDTRYLSESTLLKTDRLAAQLQLLENAAKGGTVQPAAF